MLGMKYILKKHLNELELNVLVASALGNVSRCQCAINEWKRKLNLSIVR